MITHTITSSDQKNLRIDAHNAQINVRDDYFDQELHGRKLYLEVDSTVTRGRAYTGINRDDVRGLRDWLTAWLGEETAQKAPPTPPNHAPPFRGVTWEQTGGRSAPLAERVLMDIAHDYLTHSNPEMGLSAVEYAEAQVNAMSPLDLLTAISDALEEPREDTP